MVGPHTCRTQLAIVVADCKESNICSQKCLVEPRIPGEYQKFNSNSGWVHDQASLTEALSHFSYQDTNGECLLCDLQGHVDCTRYHDDCQALVLETPLPFGMKSLPKMPSMKFLEELIIKKSSCLNTSQMTELQHSKKESLQIRQMEQTIRLYNASRG